MEHLTPDQAAALAGITVRRLNQLVAEHDGPKHCEPARFNCAEFGRWLAYRQRPDTFQSERIRLTKSQADLSELQTAELRGELIRIEDVIRAWGEKITSWRAKLLAFPSKIAQRIASPERMTEVQAQAQAVVYEILNEFSGAGLPAGVRERAGPAVHDLGATADIDGQPVGGPTPDPQSRIKRGAGKVGNRNR